MKQILLALFGPSPHTEPVHRGPLDHPEIARMGPRELADLPLPRMAEVEERLPLRLPRATRHPATTPRLSVPCA
ncbi:hypothetical protein [Alloyangia pacifica]|uniref:Uncharacterized protein n=1 Tax=Alloyangia pacifica TaxID=311180 RepID=A0A1I6VA20_9RHOB|nr:hypothetical protein [Alloyangia pacifica]SDH87380.1 hypothetical protein SAMN04488245_110133 [Alloyangia pacifica]SFT10556.1 hypothetical protein SAMN04488050_110132 [Alloyangia pacifica]